jgi:hypothetical protein
MHMTQVDIWHAVAGGAVASMLIRGTLGGRGALLEGLQPLTSEMKIWQMPKIRIHRLMPKGVPG